MSQIIRIKGDFLCDVQAQSPDISPHSPNQHHKKHMRTVRRIFMLLPELKGVTNTSNSTANTIRHEDQ